MPAPATMGAGARNSALLVLHGVLGVLGVVLDVVRGGGAFLLDGAGCVRRRVFDRLGGDSGVISMPMTVRGALTLGAGAAPRLNKWRFV